jgi:menaquinone-dependent protoporphyrinogen oxidase
MPAAPPSVGHDPPLSDALEAWLSTGEDTSLGALIGVFGPKSFALVFVLLLGVPALPLPTGGATHVFEVVAVLVALELVTGRDRIWLPRSWARLDLGAPGRRRFVHALLGLVRRLERVSRPRLRFLFHHRVSDAAFGLLVAGGAAAAFLAPPFSGLDTLPALGVVLLSLGVLLEDALVALLGGAGRRGRHRRGDPRWGPPCSTASGRCCEGNPHSGLRLRPDGAGRGRRETRRTMTPRVLVVHASRKGSTREVADAIAARLETNGLRTVVQDARDPVDLRTFDAVVLGGALYTGRWHRDARRFLRRHERVLATMPLAVFAMGPAATDDHSMTVSLAQLERALGRTADLQPVAITVFGGVIDPERLRFPFNRMPPSDARDWDAITAWADEVAEHVQGLVAAVGAGDAWGGTRRATP